MTNALDAYMAAMADAHAIFDATQTADELAVAFAAFNAASASSHLAYDRDYQAETAEGQA